MAITTACPWFQPTVCLELYTELGAERGIPIPESCYLSSSQTMDPGTTNCQTLPLGNLTAKHEPNPLGDVALTESCSPQTSNQNATLLPVLWPKLNQEGRVGRAGSKQSSPTPRGPAQIPFHDLMDSWHKSQLSHPALPQTQTDLSLRAT